MRRVFGNDLELMRIYQTSRLMDNYQPEAQNQMKISSNQNEEEISFSQLLTREIQALSMMRLSRN